MTTKYALESEFIKIRSDVFKKVGKGALDDETICKLLKPVLGDKFIGAMAWNTYKPIPGKFAVVNTGSSKSAGVHWTGVYATPTSIYVYDSFNRSPATLFPHLVKQLKSTGLSVRRGEIDKQQRDSSAICGQSSVAWCILVNRFGITVARNL